MAVSVTAIKELREATGAGVIACKQALEEAGGDLEKAKEFLRRRGLTAAQKLAQRETKNGLIEVYVHWGARIGAMVELDCETDFVARTDEFKELAHNVAMQVAATNPRYLEPREMSPGDDTSEACLVAQPFIKDPQVTVQELVDAVAAKVRERVVVKRFVRFEVGTD
ncbi:MAG: elongation factor Ts [Chloroflexi bacterium]|nr:elongation factor Ts [Chloroflexota bacterium]